MNKHLRTFVRAGLAYGIFMGGYFFIQNRRPLAAALGLLSGIPFGAAMAFLGWRGERRLRARGFNVTDMSPIQERQISYPGTREVALDAAKTALSSIRKLREVTVNEQNGEIAARTGMTWQSIGENIHIRVEAASAGCVVHIKSKPKLSTTQVDYGKGAENVEAFSQALHKLAASTGNT